MADTGYPLLITDLPPIDLPLEGVQGWLSQGADHQIVFFEIEPVGAIPPHSHGAQWGIVVEGEMELMIGGETTTYRRGDSYYIPAGVEHAATFRTHFRAIDVFADADRYAAGAAG